MVFVTGAAGVMGRASIGALLAAGHQVRGLARSAEAARTVEALGAEVCLADLFNGPGLRRGLEGCDAVANLATKVPVGRAALRPGSLRAIDRLRTEGAELVVDAALDAGVPHLVQHSLSLIYADHGDEVIDEDAPIDISPVTEPVVVAEGHAARFVAAGGHAVSLRFGLIMGDDRNTAWMLRRARAGRPFGLGDPDAWLHVVHPDDVGAAVAHALGIPSGVYNVGAEPIRRADAAALIAAAAGRPRARSLPGWVVRAGATKLEILTRSQRVDSGRLRATGFRFAYPEFDRGWVDGLV